MGMETTTEPRGSHQPAAGRHGLNPLRTAVAELTDDRQVPWCDYMLSCVAEAHAQSASNPREARRAQRIADRLYRRWAREHFAPEVTS